MHTGKKINLLIKSVPITSDLGALYEMFRSNSSETRRRAAIHLMKLIEEGACIDEGRIRALLRAERDIGVAADLKRVLNKMKIRQLFSEDPTSKYDQKLSPAEEEEILDEIEKLRRLYDKSHEEEGLLERKYRLIGKIADGGMGKIYKGIRLQDKEVVAIKFLLLEGLAKDNDRERIIERFKREGEILKRLDHPNIIKGFEFGEADGEYFIIMEYVEGVTIEERLKEGPFDFTMFKNLALQICYAMQYLHDNEIIHRDIKPGNILIRGQGSGPQIKICDLGLAKDKKDSKLSKFLFQAGTDVYVSPDQAKDARDADERDDIYSVGQMFYEMLTGITLRKDEPYPEYPISDMAVPKEIHAIIKRCVSLERRERWQSVRELLVALKKFS